MRSLAAILTRSARESACIFLHYFAAVSLYCDLGDAEFPTNLFIQPARDHQCHNLTFATGKGCVTVPELLHVRLRFEMVSEPSPAIENRTGSAAI